MRLGYGGWVAALALMGACVLQMETVPGPKGEQGEPGVQDTAALATLQAKIDILQARAEAANAKIAALEDEVKALGQRVEEPECPAGYTRDPSTTDFVVCEKGVDEVVKVGTGGSAF